MEISEDLFDNDTIELINEFVEKKIPFLNNCQDFKSKKEELSNLMDDLELNLEKEQKEKFDKFINLNFQLEQYYFALAYSLGIKYGKTLKQI